MTKSRSKDAGRRTFILELANGNTRKITVPGNWKLTYGQIVPFENRGQRPGPRADFALRLYEGSKENLRAVMTDVVSIRDATIEISEKRTQVKRQAAQKHTSKGMKDVVVEARVTEWVNPDKEDESAMPEEFLKLPATEEIDF